MSAAASPSGKPVVDFHMHLYPTASAGERRKFAYQIWEYGTQAEVVESADSGTPDEAVAALDRGGIDYGVIANLFEVEHVPADLADAREGGVDDADRSLRDVLEEFNGWACDVGASEPRLIPFMAVDPRAMTVDQTIVHLRAMRERGAKGIKIHPVLQGIDPTDQGWWPMFAACADLGLVVLSHSGPARPGAISAEPAAFRALADHVPSMTLVLAHAGGGAWRDTKAAAEALPRAFFDVCEIIERTNSEIGPTRDELAGLIQAIGPQRVLFGSDFPWYEPGHSLGVLRSLPGLSATEVDAIAGENAARLLGLD